MRYLIPVVVVAIVAALFLYPSAPDASGPAQEDPLVAVDHYEWCPSTAVTTLPATVPMPNRRKVVLQNLATDTDCFFTFDAENPTSTGALGYKLGKGETSPVFDFGPAVPLKAICTAETSTGACVQLIQAR